MSDVIPFLRGGPVRDADYRRSAVDRYCEVPGCYVHGSGGTVVLAHINISNNFGMGLKAGDDESFFLCFNHHKDFDHSLDRCRWIVENIVRPTRKGLYLRFRADRCM